MSYRNITGWGLRGPTPGPAVCTSTSGRDPLAGGHRRLAVSPTRSSWRVVPRHEQQHGFFLSRHAGRRGPRGLDRMRSVGGGLALSRALAGGQGGLKGHGEEKPSLPRPRARDKQSSAWTFPALLASARPSRGRSGGSGEGGSGRRGILPGCQQPAIVSGSSPSHAATSPADTLPQECPCPWHGCHRPGTMEASLPQRPVGSRVTELESDVGLNPDASLFVLLYFGSNEAL